MSEPSPRALHRLFAAALFSSQDKLNQVVAVSHLEEMVRLPALAKLVQRNPDFQPFRLRYDTYGSCSSKWQLLCITQRMLRSIFLRIAACVELQSFVSAPEPEVETAVRYSSPAEREHIERVLKNATRRSVVNVAMEDVEPGVVRLTRTQGNPALHDDVSELFIPT